MNLKKRIAAGILIAIASIVITIFSMLMYKAIGIIGVFVIPGLLLLVGVLTWCTHTLVYDDE